MPSHYGSKRKKLVKAGSKAVKALAGDAAKRAKKRRLLAKQNRTLKDQPAIDARRTPTAADRARKYLKLPAGTPVKGHVVGGGRGTKKQPPVLRGVSAKQLSEAHSVTELNKMIKSVRSGRIGKGLSDKENASQIKRLNKAIDSKARTKADVEQIMKEGQRQWNPKEGMVMKRGGLIGPSYRHGRKDYRKGNVTKG